MELPGPIGDFLDTIKLLLQTFKLLFIKFWLLDQTFAFGIMNTHFSLSRLFTRFFRLKVISGLTLYIGVHNYKLKQHAHHSPSKLFMMLGINKNHVEYLLKSLDSLFGLSGTHDKMLVRKFWEFDVFVIVLKRQVKGPEVVHGFLCGQRSILLLLAFILELDFYYVISLLYNIYVMSFLPRYFNRDVLRVHMVDKFNFSNLSFNDCIFLYFDLVLIWHLIILVRNTVFKQSVIALGVIELYVTFMVLG